MTQTATAPAEPDQDASRGNARERILAAAEEVIAELGYGATSLRRIADRAGVPVTLISYHFGTKLELYRTIFRLRAPAIIGQRRTGLDIARMEPDLDRRLDLVVRALIVPLMSPRTSGHFGTILAREVVDAGNTERGIFAEMFDPVAAMLLAALRECLPDWTEAEVHYAYNTMLGATLYFIADTGRIVRLSGGQADPDRTAEVAQHLVDILVAGLRHRRRR